MLGFGWRNADARLIDRADVRRSTSRESAPGVPLVTTDYVVELADGSGTRLRIRSTDTALWTIPDGVVVPVRVNRGRTAARFDGAALRLLADALRDAGTTARLREDEDRLRRRLAGDDG